MRNLKQLLKGEHIVGLTDVIFEKDRVCSACVAGKQLKKRHPIKSIIITSRPLELLHLDLFGPSHYDTLGGRKYGLVIIDDYSRYSWVFLLKTKDETYKEFIIFAKRAQRMYEAEIKAIRTDNGTEFKNYTPCTSLLMMRGSSMSSELHILLSKMVLLKGRTGLLLRSQESC